MTSRHWFLLALLWAGCVPAATAEPLPRLAEAFGRPIAGAGGVAPGTDLFRIEVPSTRYPLAHCADGTPAVFFVRHATAAEHRDRWVIYLQGGGTCDNGQDCHERWLGRDGNFGGNKLSSRFAPARGMAGGGIESPHPRNPFAAWNHVFVYYCSSDSWIGERADVATTAVHGGVEVSYRIDFLGGRIVDAVLDLLRGAEGLLSYRNADGLSFNLPDLDTATDVLFSGSSAGGSGARSHADSVGTLLREHNLRCGLAACPLNFAAVLDASYGVASETLDYRNSTICGPDRVGSCTYEFAMAVRFSTVVQGFWGGRSDASCLAYHMPTQNQYLCADGAHVLQHHLQSPFFVRTDLQDSLHMGKAIEAGFAFEGVPLDRTLYGMLEEIQLLEIATLAERAEEPRPPGALEPPGVFGPQCGDHEALRSDAGSFRRQVETADGSRHYLLGVLHNWLVRRSPSAVIQHFDSSGAPASCNL